MGTAVAHVAIPEYERGIGFDHLEGVLALSWLCHLCLVSISGCVSLRVGRLYLDVGFLAVTEVGC